MYSLKLCGSQPKNNYTEKHGECIKNHAYETNEKASFLRFLQSKDK